MATLRTASVPVAIWAFTVALPLSAQSPAEWTAYGRDAFGTRYSPLSQISRDNVAKLVPAWTYRTDEMETTHQPTKFEATPLFVDGTLFLATPFARVIALDPVTGQPKWTFDAKVDHNGDWGDFANRGVSTWVDRSLPATARCRRRIFVGTIDARIIAVDSRTGTPCLQFGASGTVDLRAGLTNRPYYHEEYQLTSPPAIVHDLLITGSSVADNARTNAASGEVRAFDVRTGALRWTWDPVPRDSTDPAWSTWRGPMAHTTGAANAWSVIVADSARDLVFVPTGSASPDYYGGERLGDNRYANSIVALRASTGKVVWHFQTVHHDLWDYDNASPPVLATITHEGRRVDVVLQATKTGQLFVLDRDSGKPIFPVEERRVPASSVRGEAASPTQPFNTVIPALSPQTFSADSVWAPNAEIRDACLAMIRPLRNDGPFTPPSLEGTLVIPSNVGGAHWGGVAFDPTREIAVVPVNRIAARVQLIRVDQLDTLDMHANQSRLGDQYTRMHGTPYVMRRNMAVIHNVPCTPPPWGSLVAIDLKTGAKLWDVPLGDPSTLYPALASVSKTPLGLPNLGGPIATAGGLAFVGATFDHMLRAFDIQTGRELWRGALPAGARATPMTYEVNGRQYVVVCVGGSEEWGKGDYVIAFALPH
ncbi:MAG TPA: pyrroloquinoline quinone-dependent dehydrogenase [Gemmatimonadaceae bacterium]